jgi:hypothetical protein
MLICNDGSTGIGRSFKLSWGIVKMSANFSSLTLCYFHCTVEASREVVDGLKAT